MKKGFSPRPRSEFFEQYKGVEDHFVDILLSARGGTPPNTFAHSSPHGAIPRRPVLHVQVDNCREKTFGHQAGLLRACESHAVRSAHRA